MLTFSFTGVDGTMTECETLTSGMVGKQVRILLDDSWDPLSKTVVFRAADVNRVVIQPEFPLITIPDAVLARPFGKLFVGVCGTDQDGAVVIPTIMAEGPMIRYGADPIQDETAGNLPVWKNLQEQIGDLSSLKTEEKENLAAAVNELHHRMQTLASEARQLQEAVSYLGEPLALETRDKTSLVGAINELRRELNTLPGLNGASARLLLDILRKGTYSEPQEDAIAALAEALDAKEELPPLFYWDFRTGSLADLVTGAVAVAHSSVILDEAGAHLTGPTSYLTLPAAPEGSTLAGYTAEIKFGQMSLNTQATVLRLACSCLGLQPATSGIIWTSEDCWSTASSITTEFTDIHMFSGKTLYAKAAPEGNRIDWYCENQLICSSASGTAHTHISIGSSSTAAYPAVVEYVKIYPAS